LTVTDAESFGAVPALPEYVGKEVVSVLPFAGADNVTAGAVVSLTATTSCGWFADSRLPNRSATEALLVRTKVTVLLLVTREVTFRLVRVPAVNAPEDAVIVAEGVGAFLYVMLPSFQLFAAERTSTPVAALAFG
jgi:hypothetical protein